MYRSNLRLKLLVRNRHKLAVSVMERVEVVEGDTSKEQVFKAACSLGGEAGWHRYTFLWQLRGISRSAQQWPLLRMIEKFQL
jgi:hypothetical protein